MVLVPKLPFIHVLSLISGLCLSLRYHETVGNGVPDTLHTKLTSVNSRTSIVLSVDCTSLIRGETRMKLIYVFEKHQKALVPYSVVIGSFFRSYTS